MSSPVAKSSVTPAGEFPVTRSDEREQLLDWLGYLRCAVIRNAEGLSEAAAHERPGGRLISIVGIVNHLTQVEWRWIDGGFGGEYVTRDDEEFHPGSELQITEAVARYRVRGKATDETVRALSLDTFAAAKSWGDGHSLRFVLLHLVNETARHAGHADAVRELLDGSTGE